VMTTLCCAWRWKIVAGGLGVELSLAAAVAAYYRSLFINVTVPGGIVGDVHRGISHGRDVSDVGGALRAVAWERFAGQLVQAVLTVVVLLALPSPVRSAMPLVALAVVAGVVGAGLVARRQLRLARKAWLGVGLASALVVGGHAATFLVAARTAGVTASPSVMLAMVLPSAGGWGPREGVTAWAFGAAGLGVQQGVATAVAYGVMVLVASLPGAAVLLVSSCRGIQRRGRTRPALAEGAAPA